VKGKDRVVCWLEGGGSTGRHKAAVETSKLSRKFSSLKDSTWKVLELFPKKSSSCLSVYVSKLSMYYINTYEYINRYTCRPIYACSMFIRIGDLFWEFSLNVLYKFS
jgi:hypothetical protein